MTPEAVFSRWSTASRGPGFRVARTEIGLGHDEGRKYQGLIRHMMLCQQVLLFVAELIRAAYSQVCGKREDDMAVYVGPLRKSPRLGRGALMVAGSVTELQTMAMRLGMPLRWMKQRPARFVLTSSQRRGAISAGAIPCSYSDLMGFTQMGVQPGTMGMYRPIAVIGGSPAGLVHGGGEGAAALVARDVVMGSTFTHQQGA